jgi:opacity protein-like surface antigen
MRLYSVVNVLLIAILSVSATAQADTYRSRAERWEFTTQMRYLEGKSIQFTGGSEIDINSNLGWGFSIGYNFSDHLAMGLDVGWNSPSYNARIASADNPGEVNRANSQLSTSSLHLNLIYNFIAGPITPFVSAGVGSTYVDSNLAYGPSVGTCWWDPYWGYVCGNYQPTYSASQFSYIAGVGVRWDINRDMFLRAAIGAHWIDLGNGGTQDFTTSRLEIGFSY